MSTHTHYIATKTVELGGVANSREPDLAKTLKLMADYLALFGEEPEEWRFEITRPTRNENTLFPPLGTVSLVTPSGERFSYQTPILR